MAGPDQSVVATAPVHRSDSRPATEQKPLCGFPTARAGDLVLIPTLQVRQLRPSDMSEATQPRLECITLY